MLPPAFRYQLLVSVYFDGPGEHAQTEDRDIGEHEKQWFNASLCVWHPFSC